MTENKKIMSREEFENLRINEAKKMSQDKILLQDALNVKVRAGHDYYWVHQTNWFGEPALQLTQDLFAYQEAIFNSRPQYIIEIGVAWGGSLLFYSTLMEALGGKKVIGVDVFMPDDLIDRLKRHGKISERLRFISGSSTDPSTINKINEITDSSNEVMVILDSFHTHDHVLQELRMYSPLVGKGYYLICGDTIIEYQPPAKRRPRPWGKGNNPKTALDEFLKENDRFVIDQAISNKLLFTNNPGGILRCVKDL
jgi:cephalosporin hydroxylase